MRFIVADNYSYLSRNAAAELAHYITKRPSCVLGLATGTTPIGLYNELVKTYECGDLSFAQVSTFNLDEYRGLSGDHEQSYRAFMDRHLFDRVDIDKAHTHVPDGANPDAAVVCNSYEAAIEASGGIDVQLLGLGHNGHIGFNEPAADFPRTTHLVRLTQSTIDANSRLFSSKDEVPREAYTMGVGTIMRARAILLVVQGASKANIVRRACFGPVTPNVPASILQFHHNLTVLVDREAAAQC